MSNKVIIFSAPSGAGKSTIVNHLLGLHPELEFSISATSRAPRGEARYNEILERRAAQAVQCDMSGDFMKKVFEAIHEESVRQQMEILNN